jgi:hypothetical protein
MITDNFIEYFKNVNPNFKLTKEIKKAKVRNDKPILKKSN